MLELLELLLEFVFVPPFDEFDAAAAAAFCALAVAKDCAALAYAKQVRPS